MAGRNRYDFKDIKKKGREWIKSTMNLLPREEHPNALSQSSFTGRRHFTREIMAERLLAALRIIHSQADFIELLDEEAMELKSNLIARQTHVIEAQKELIEAKNSQLQELSDSVVSSVGKTVQTQLQSYSDAVQVQAARNGSGNAINQSVLKTVVKNVVAEEDRSRNLIIYGLAEDEEENIGEKVEAVFSELSEKPKCEANRIGKVGQHRPRPVKVSVSNSSVVTQILTKCRNLRNIDRFKDVFISPDRTKEERDERRDLVKQLKLKRTAEPDKHFSIKKGQIICSTGDDNIVN